MIRIFLSSLILPSLMNLALAALALSTPARADPRLGGNGMRAPIATDTGGNWELSAQMGGSGGGGGGGGAGGAAAAAAAGARGPSWAGGRPIIASEATRPPAKGTKKRVIKKKGSRSGTSGEVFIKLPPGSN
jgi:hypothetical protein